MLTFVFTNEGQVLYSGLQGKTTQKLIHLSLLQARKASEDVFKFQRLVQLKECAIFMSKPDVKVEVQTSFKMNEEEMDVKSVKIKSEPEDLEEVSDSEEEEGEILNISSDGSD